jgi:hypothetical protein
MEYICGQFNSQIYLYTLNIPILYTQAADAFKIRFQDMTVTLTFSGKYSYFKGNKKNTYECSN